MKTKNLWMALSALMLFSAATVDAKKKKKMDLWPDGTVVSEWFKQANPATLESLGKQYVLTEHGVKEDSTLLQTLAIQAVIDKAARSGEKSVVVVPQGTFLSGALFMRQGVNLWIVEGGKLKGSDDINQFPVMNTRIEGQTCKYFCALLNADGLDGVTIAGKGVVDGNGLNYWKAFWVRRSWNPQCTNKDEQRPRLLYVSNCKNVEVSGLTLQHSPFWTSHYYRCENVRALNLRILSPASPVKAPSTDAIDIDVCKNMLVKGCYMAVNDDAIALKGGKGAYADQDETNGSNENIIIEDCEYGFCHGCLTCGSESIHNKNIILRRIQVNHGQRLLWLKMRPDTPQQYEYITVEDITGDVTNFIYVRPWTQFFDMQGRTDMPISYGDHITMKNCTLQCRNVFEVQKSEQYRLSNFFFENLKIKAQGAPIDESQVENFTIKGVDITFDD